MGFKQSIELGKDERSKQSIESGKDTGFKAEQRRVPGIRAKRKQSSKHKSSWGF